MSLVRLTGVAKYFGSERLFGDIEATVNPGDKIGLIGRNGIGKTTLLRLIAGVESPDEGRVVLRRNACTGWLRQELPSGGTGTLWDYVAAAHSEVAQLEGRLADLERAMARPEVQAQADELGELLDEYARVRARFEYAGGYSSEATVRATLFSLGFSERDLQLSLQALSGGQKARAALAHLLLTAPDLLLLDEPTNHLDVTAVEWLEQYLKGYQGAMVVVSHDRAFLDAFVGRIWDMEDGTLFTYSGNYSAARETRAERRARSEKEYLAQQRDIAAIEEYVRRYKEGNRATMARSRERALERMERISRPTREQGAMHLRLDAGLRSGRNVVTLDGVGKSFAGNEVLAEANLVIRRGDRIGIVGPNGSGKSTLLCMVAGCLEPSVGKIRYGKDVVIAHFSQQMTELDPGNTVIEELLASCSLNLWEGRAHLARFMFRGEDVWKSVGVLSGGERNRLTLAKLVLAQANLLLLDEPTNHLDIPSREALEESLGQYEGTLVFVSHDRYLLTSLARRVWVVEEGHVADHPCSYADYRAQAVQLATGDNEHVAVGPNGRRGNRVSPELQTQRELQRQAKKTKAKLQELEQRISVAEGERERLEQALADTALYSDGELARETTRSHREIVATLEKLYARWEVLAEEAAILVTDEG